jgi:DNA-binding transcriptional regulator YdaS (Cro superfamily)
MLPAMNLAKYLRANKIRPSAFAQTVGVANSNVLRWLAGKHRPSLTSMAAIERATQGEVTMRDFIFIAPRKRKL